ncbi:MAG: hypothetical protein MI864_06895 [Pseudomonadales bacterium]|nr:hypothetical protein [Pseudomonadales bacterium]
MKISKPAMIGAFGGSLAGVLCALIASSLLPLDEEQQFALILFGALPPAV